METPDREDIWLTNLKFTRQQQDEEIQDQPQARSRYESDSGAALLKGQEAAPRTFARTDPSKSNPYDRLGSDKPGEELTPDSTIWKLYANEARVYDEELVLDNNRYLDMMLVFGALFSAILTSFVLESKDMMQPDAVDTSNLLLMRIAARLDNPNLPLVTLDAPTFQPSSAARWINGLWFTALAFSLSAIFLAILAKEWLDTFRSLRPRLAHIFSLVRQARLDALDSWGVFLVVKFIAFLLHIALLMFFLGLVVYIYTEVDRTIAAVVALTTGATTLFYFITNFLSVLFEICPFGTQISYSVRRLLSFLVDNWKYAQRWRHYFVIKLVESYYHTSEQDLHALHWLANHAKDPQVADSAYHALAGFRSDSPISGNTSVTSSRNSTTLPTTEAPASMKHGSTSERKQKLIVDMFIDICYRLRDAPTSRAHELEVSCGASVARYTATLPRLVIYLQGHPDRELLERLSDTRRRFIGANMELFDPPKQALNALDSILDNSCPPFTADAYVSITASELSLVTGIVNSIKSTRNSRRYTGDFTNQQTRRNGNSVEAGFGMIFRIDPRHNSEVNIFELQARYSRSLARASFQMFFHSNDRAPMSAFSLISLLRSLEKAAQCDDLNQTTHGRSHPLERRLSTHHPQNPNASTKLPDFNIFLVGAGDSYELRSGEIGDPCGLIAGILDILGASGTGNVAGVEAAAADALNAIAPMLIEQLLGTTPSFSDLVGIHAQRRTGSVTIVDMTNRTSPHGIEWATATPASGPETFPRSPITSSPLQSPRLPGASSFPAVDARGWPVHIPNLSMTYWSLGQMIVLAAFAKSHKETPGIGELSKLSLRAFNHRFQSCSPRSSAFSIASTYLSELRYFVDHFDPLESTITDPESANTHLLQILALKEDRTVYSTLLANDLGTPSQLLRIMQSAFAPPPATIETLLSDVSDSASSYWPYFAESGNSDDQGFTQLLKLGDRHAYRPGVARCIFKLVQTAATPTPKYSNGPGVTIGGLPAFFEATRFVLNHHAANPKKPLDLYKFIENVFKVVRVIDSKHDELIKDIIPRKEIKGFMETISKNTPLKEQVRKDLMRFEDMGAKNVGSKSDNLSNLAASAYDPLLKLLTELKRQADHEPGDGPAPKDVLENE